MPPNDSNGIHAPMDDTTVPDGNTTKSPDGPETSAQEDKSLSPTKLLRGSMEGSVNFFQGGVLGSVSGITEGVGQLKGGITGLKDGAMDINGLALNTLTGHVDGHMEKLSDNVRRSKNEQAFVDDEPPESETIRWYRWRIGMLLITPQFQFIVIVLIGLNGVVLGLEADGRLSHSVTDMFEIFFMVAFTMEILVKIAVFGPRVYFSDNYNILDALIVLSADISDVILWLNDSGTGSEGGGVITAVTHSHFCELPFMSILQVRMFRVFRLTR